MFVYECTGIRYRKRKVPDSVILKSPSKVYRLIKTRPGAIGPAFRFSITGFTASSATGI